MNSLLVAVMVAYCGAVSVPQYQQGWSPYIVPANTDPVVVRFPIITISIPSVNTLPKIPTIAIGTNVISVSVRVPNFKIAAAPVPVVKTVATPAISTPVQVAGPVQVTTPVHVAGPVQVASPVQVTAYQAPVVVAAAPEPLLAPEPPMPSLNVPFVGGQFHSQDEAKQYSFGHWGGPNTRVEVKDSLGRVSGSFAYVNPDGDVHVRKYAAAPGMGFKVAASDLPEDTPAVAMVKAVLAQAHADAKDHRQ